MELTGRKALGNAIALNSTIFNGARMLGPALAGIMMSTVGLAACFFINAISYLPVVVALSRITATGAPASSSRESLFASIRGALVFVRGDKTVRRMML